MSILKAHAKINLGLEVLYKRNDGYHEINTIFHKICLHDEITVQTAKELTVSCIPPLGIPQEKNLVYQAGKLLQNYYECKSKGAKITIHKNIPDGGGLGGGSSDAASTLIALNDLWNIAVPIDQLMKIAIELGSDIPFFLGGNTALGTGRGEILDYFDFHLPYHILIVLPEIHISTPIAYSSLIRGEAKISGENLKKKLLDNLSNPLRLKEHIKNDFEDFAFSQHPELKIIKNSLYDSGACFSLMSGSGSTVFGLFDDLDNISKAQNLLSKYRIMICPIQDNN